MGERSHLAAICWQLEVGPGRRVWQGFKEFRVEGVQRHSAAATAGTTDLPEIGRSVELNMGATEGNATCRRARRGLQLRVAPAAAPEPNDTTGTSEEESRRGRNVQQMTCFPVMGSGRHVAVQCESCFCAKKTQECIAGSFRACHPRGALLTSLPSTALFGWRRRDGEVTADGNTRMVVEGIIEA